MSHEPIPQLSLEQAWEMLTDDPHCVLVDVRTSAEWNFVGLPDLRSLPNELRTVEWTSFPTGVPNPDFVAQASSGVDNGRNILLLCRSGARSQAAAEALRDAGFARVHNIAAGFEGPLDALGHRADGWKDHLPWVQS